jgi:hypothetical protein
VCRRVGIEVRYNTQVGVLNPEDIGLRSDRIDNCVNGYRLWVISCIVGPLQSLARKHDPCRHYHDHPHDVDCPRRSDVGRLPAHPGSRSTRTAHFL